MCRFSHPNRLKMPMSIFIFILVHVIWNRSPQSHMLNWRKFHFQINLTKTNYAILLKLHQLSTQNRISVTLFADPSQAQTFFFFFFRQRLTILIFFFFGCKYSRPNLLCLFSYQMHTKTAWHRASMRER